MNRFDAPAFEHVHTVTFGDTNATGNVYFARLFEWQGTVRELFLVGHAPEVLAALGAEISLVTVSASAQFLAELWPFDRVAIRLKADDPVQNRMRMRFDYWRVGGEIEELVATSEQTVAWLSRSHHNDVPKPLPVPDSLRSAIRVATEEYRRARA